MDISEEERKVLYSYALSMYGKLNGDKNVNQATKDFWWTLSEKLRKG